MFGSQVLETATGLILMFFIIALGASSLTEAISRLVGKRSSNLEDAIKSLLSDSAIVDPSEDDGKRLVGDRAALLAAQRKHKQLRERLKSVSDADLAELKTEIADAENNLAKKRREVLDSLSQHPWEWFSGTTIYESARAATRGTFSNERRSPSYLSAKAFADAAVEMAVEVSSATADIDLTLLPGKLGVRLNALALEVGDDAIKVKAGLEQWFDDTMERLEGAYKRWVTAILFILGLTIAVAANASTFHVAERLWQDPITREVVVAAADNLVDGPTPLEAGDLPSLASTTDQLVEVGLPVGWDEAAEEAWSAANLKTADGLVEAVTYLAGWTLTALLVTLGAPFWFDLLTRVSSLRSSGAKPKTAINDPASASFALAGTS